MKSRFPLIALALLFVSAAGGWTEVTANKPAFHTWPKTFSLIPGETADFGIPMTQAGDIMVNLQWQGVPLTVQLMNPAGGNPVKTSTPQNPASAKVTFSITAADLQKSPLWIVRIAAPGKMTPSKEPAAKGQITIQSPPVTEQQIKSIQDSTRAARSARIRAFAAKTPAPPLPSNTALAAEQEKLSVAAIKSRETLLRNRMTANLTAFTANMTKLAKRPGASSVGTAMPNPTTVKPPVTQIPPGAINVVNNAPTLTELAPKQGMPGDQIVVSGKNLPLDKSQCEVHFIIGNGIDVIANVTNVMQDTGLIRYQTQTPSNSNATGPYNGLVYMKLKTSGVTTNELDFSFIPAPLPTITSTDLQIVGPGDMLLANGTNFGPDDNYYFIWGDNNGVPAAQKQYFSPQQVRIKVPEYTSAQPLNGLIYGVNKGLVKGPLYSIAMKSTVPKIDNLYEASGQPRTPILIEGSGFRMPLEVHFVDESGNDRISDVASSDDCSIMTHVPNVSGIATDKPWRVYVKSNGLASNRKEFTFKPEKVELILDVNKAGLRADSAVYAYWTDPDVWQDDGPAIGNCDWNEWIIRGDSTAYVVHGGGFFWGLQGFDTFFKTFKLKNGWVVSGVDLDARFTPGEACAQIMISLVGTPSLFTQIYWFDTADGDSVHYYLSYKIKGPKGVPYM